MAGSGCSEIAPPSTFTGIAASCFQEPGASEEYGAGTGRKEQPAADAGILLKILLAPFDRAQRKRVDDGNRLPAALENEQSTDTFPHGAHYARSGPAAEMRGFDG